MSINIEDLLKQANDGYDDAAKSNTFQVDPRILTLKKNVTYKGRFVINGKDPGRSRVPYNEFMFTSRLDGKTLAYGGRDPNDLKEVKEDIWTKTKWDEYAKAKESGTEKTADAPYKLLNPKRKELINFYLHEVIGDDAEATTKIGQVVVLKFPAQMNFDKKTGKNVYRSDILIRIEEGLSGDDKSEIGDRAWKLGKEGRSFIVKVTEKDKYPNYSGSKWADAKDLGLKEEQIKDIIFNKAHNLLEFVPKTLSQEELKAILDKHYFCTSANAEDDVDTDTDLPDTDDGDLIPGLGKKFQVDDDLSLDGI